MKKIRFFAILIMTSFTLSVNAQTSVNDPIIYCHRDSASFMARCVKGGAKLFVSKNSIAKKLEKENFVSEPVPIPKKYLKEFQVDISQVNCRNVYTISPKSNKSSKVVLFLHGGGYINNIFGPHWDFAAILVRETGCTVVIPDYPLAPAATYVDAFAMLDEVYMILLSDAEPQDIIFMGDSAGGGLALAFAQNNLKNEIPQPSQIILISPWLDVSMVNPEIQKLKKSDPVLNAETLVMAGKVWAGDAATDNFLVSPIYGEFKGLAEISVFIGGDDILYADCKKLKTLMARKSIPMNYFEYPEMFHDWVMFGFLKEAKLAVKQINELILR